MMTRLLTAALLGAAALAPAAGAQTITADAPVRASFSASDPRRGDGSPYRIYWYDAQAGERLVVSMTSPTLDSYLMVGRRPSGGASAPDDLLDVERDDDGGEGLNAELEYTFRSAGRYGIVATAYGRDASGSFELSLRRAGGAPASAASITVDTPVRASFSASDPRRGDGSPYRIYWYDAQAGERLVVSMTSPTLDSYLMVGRRPSGGASAPDDLLDVERDDDGGEGLNAELEYTFRSAGRYGIVATAYGRDASGSFQLSLRRPGGAPTATAGGSATFVRLGETLQGRLDGTSPQDDGGRRYETFWYRGTRGERVAATMTSGDFDTYVAVAGPVSGTPSRTARYTERVGDDDGGGGTNSRLVFTLPADGLWAFRARSYGSGAQGAFTFRLERTTDPEPDRSEAPRARRPGEGPAPQRPQPQPQPPARRTYTLDEAVEIVVANQRENGFSLGYSERHRMNRRASHILRLNDVRAGEEVSIVVLEEDGRAGAWIQAQVRFPSGTVRQLDSPAVQESRAIPGVLMSAASVRIPSGWPTGSIAGFVVQAGWYDAVSNVHILMFVK